MPKIPQFENRRLPPSTTGGEAPSPQMVSAPYQALSGIGQQLQRIGNIQAKIAEKEQLASDTLEAARIQRELDAESLKIDESYHNRSDYDKFEPDLENTLNEIQGRIFPKGATPRLNNVVQKSFDSFANTKRVQVKAQKWKVMGDTGKVELTNLYDSMVRQWAEEPDPEKRNLLKTAFRIQAETMKNNYAVDPLWAEDLVDKFDASAEKTAIDMADVAADKLIESDPANAAELLKNKNLLSDLPPKLRQDKIEKANAAKKVYDNEVEQKRKEAEKKAHDAEDGKITSFYINGEYHKAFLALKNSKFLTGAETRAWKNAIESASKEETIDSKVYTDLKRNVFVNPEQISETDIWMRSGNGITAEQGEGLVKDLRDNLKKTDRAVKAKEAHEMLERFRNKNVFDDNDVENERIYQEQVAAFDDAYKKNPDMNPVEWVNKSMVDFGRGWLSKMIVKVFGKKEEIEVPVVSTNTEFDKWYADIAKKNNLNPNPDDPLHFYDYRKAFEEGAIPDETGHLPSKYKKLGHPRLIVKGIDTRTGKEATDDLYRENAIAYLGYNNKPITEANIDYVIKQMINIR